MIQSFVCIDTFIFEMVKTSCYWMLQEHIGNIKKCYSIITIFLGSNPFLHVFWAQIQYLLSHIFIPLSLRLRFCGYMSSIIWWMSHQFNLRDLAYDQFHKIDLEKVKDAISQNIFAVLYGNDAQFCCLNNM